MKVEIEAASSWWTGHLPNHLSSKKSLAFRSHLVHELEQRCSSHWYTDAPLRGSGYRSVIYDARLDPTLESAARAAGIEKYVIYNALPRGVMWLNPGEVKIRLSTMTPNETSMVIYSSKNEQQTLPPSTTSASKCAASATSSNSHQEDAPSPSTSPSPSCSSSQSSSPSLTSSMVSPPSTPTDVLAPGGGSARDDTTTANDSAFLLADSTAATAAGL